MAFFNEAGGVNTFPFFVYRNKLGYWGAGCPMPSSKCPSPGDSCFQGRLIGWAMYQATAGATSPLVGLSPSQHTHRVFFTSHIRHRTFPYHAHHLCANRAFAGNCQKFSLSLSPSPSPSLSTGVTESYVKSGRSYYAKKFMRRACPLYSSIICL